jgi:hypothetical protein
MLTLAYPHLQLRAHAHRWTLACVFPRNAQCIFLVLLHTRFACLTPLPNLSCLLGHCCVQSSYGVVSAARFPMCDTIRKLFAVCISASFFATSCCSFTTYRRHGHTFVYTCRKLCALPQESRVQCVSESDALCVANGLTLHTTTHYVSSICMRDTWCDTTPPVYHHIWNRTLPEHLDNVKYVLTSHQPLTPPPLPLLPLLRVHVEKALQAGAVAR